MYKSLISFFTTTLILSSGFVSLASSSRLYDFNNNSDLNKYFNSDGSASFENRSYGGIRLSGSINVPLGPEDLWTSKKGFITTSSDNFKISGFFYNLDSYGYGSLGFTNNNNSNSGDGRGSPATGLGIVFHGGGGYFVNNGVYTEVLWPPDLMDGNWYYFEFNAEKTGGNNFDLLLRIYRADEIGNLLDLKSIETLSVSNSDIANATNLYSYFGTADTRFTTIDNIKIELSGGAGFEEDGKPIVTTTEASNITKTSAETGGNVTDELGASVSDKGVCYGINSNPTISGTCTSDGTGPGIFTSSLTSLSENKLYYYRAFATNINGTSYGIQRTFTTLSTPASTEPTTEPQRNTNSNNDTGSSNSKSKSVKKECFNSKPPEITWMALKETKVKNKTGFTLYWSQIGADKVTILIDNGNNKFPYKIKRTKNDGQEFIPNITSNQKIKIIPHNGCRTGDETISISKKTHSKGYFKK